MNYEIFRRTEYLIGSSGLEKLSGSTVAVFGLGGVGSYAVEALARAGVGTLIIVDYDTVDITNINRQLHALNSTVGRFKTDLTASRLREINPGLVVYARQLRFSPETAAEIFNGKGIDFIIDAIDDVENKAALITESVNRGLAIVSAMGAGNKLDPTSFKVASIWKTSVCPLARVMRKRLRAAGITSDIPVVYSTECPRQIATGTGGKQVPGSISFVPPVAGFILAAYVVDKLLSLDIFSDM
ncbi:tRNA A37 threonylcarbamoyladenosine dehydratase [Desulfotomaculum arcticum]|uniref:tRNA A37 threonylcarbamoyladenosine dehydratase n=1 Tax=Desulfotruncus arcticus DSM 17038 TaxID=1121424 RepID=A0A1I2ZIL8_9FIRM|nr:tRNA threonylcarbamoyladenosine dehydratase [Desulfotruncus arcticus]SFH37702.1 tRNA A37 threonylcarbamoyladenosine dehydratase [Desulfotomaculum arcticum] [Desulfotruncus arcticus DSM 17038]